MYSFAKKIPNHIFFKKKRKGKCKKNPCTASAMAARDGQSDGYHRARSELRGAHYPRASADHYALRLITCWFVTLDQEFMM
jgi:hypothetical protein